VQGRWLVQAGECAQAASARRSSTALAFARWLPVYELEHMVGLDATVFATGRTHLACTAFLCQGAGLQRQREDCGRERRPICGKPNSPLNILEPYVHL
jgi:hypothetical protein